MNVVPRSRSFVAALLRMTGGGAIANRPSALGLFVLAIVLAACSSDAPTDPRGRTPPTPVPIPAPLPPAPPSSAFPDLTRAGVIYDRATPSSIPGQSRYVIYEDGTFSLQYLRPDWGFFEYPGRYLRADSVLTLDFKGASTAGPWQARGVLTADSSLTVAYNDVMAMADFENGKYRSSRPLAAVARIYVANADGSAITRLTSGGRPAWSPNGQRIAFQRDGLVYVTSATDSSDLFLAVGSYPAWSPDGSRIVFTSTDGIAVMNADGSHIATLIRHHFRTDVDAESDLGVGKPAWSPDGKLIAFEQLGDGDIQPAQIFVMNADGSNPHTVTTSPQGYKYAESDPAWSPDGSKIAFWSYGYGIATVPVGGGVPTAIYADFPAVAYGTKPTWSPDGSSIAFTVRSSAVPAIWTTPVNAARAHVLISAGYEAAWSPIGGRIAFVNDGLK
jgi:Tol biopolymer transport system component